MELVPATVATLVPVVSPTSEISGIYLDLVGAGGAPWDGMRSWVIIGRPRLEHHTESVGKHCFWQFIPSCLVDVSWLFNFHYLCFQILLISAVFLFKPGCTSETYSTHHSRQPLSINWSWHPTLNLFAISEFITLCVCVCVLSHFGITIKNELGKFPSLSLLSLRWHLLKGD